MKAIVRISTQFRRFATALTAALALMAVSANAENGKFPINDEDPVASVPKPGEVSGSPMDFGYWLMEVSARGDAAFTQGEFLKAARYFEALAVAAPQRATGPSRACEAYERAGELAQALESCKQALSREGVKASDATRLVTLTLATRATLTPPEVLSLDALFEILRQQNLPPALIAEQQCAVAEKLGDTTRLRKCIATLGLAGQHEGRALAFKWRLAVLEKNASRAAELLALARNDPAFSPEALLRLERETENLSFFAPPRAKFALVAGCLCALGGVAYLLLRARRRSAANLGSVLPETAG